MSDDSMEHKNVKFLVLTFLYLTLSGCQQNSVKDIDGNEYQVVKIGTQVWMKENLKTTRYRNGDTIGTTKPATLVIEDEDSPRYQWAYAGNESNADAYGRLYTWYVATDSRNVCPAGWHVPDDAEWIVLTDYLTNNGYGFGGGYHGMDVAKSMAATSGWVAEETKGWVGNDQGSNNSSGFTALPAGARLEDGNFYELGHIANWWTTQIGEGYLQGLTGETVNSQGGVFHNIYHDYCYVNSYCNNPHYGMSIRCLKDN